jgi:DNA-binding response OmpR family regulator
MEHDTTTLIACSDEQRLARICHELCADGYDAEGARTCGEARAKARNRPPQVLLVAGLGRPLEQIELLRAIRGGMPAAAGIDSQLGLIALGQAGGELELVRCLEAGADDYLAPGTGYPELRARLAAVMRRLGPRRAALKRLGALEVDPETRTASWAGRALEMSRKEFALLDYLALDPTRVVSKQELLREVWGYAAPSERTRTVDAHACRLRRKLAAAGGGELVLNVRGVGYRLCTHRRDAAAHGAEHLRAA